MYTFARLLFILTLVACIYDVAVAAAMFWPQSGFIVAFIVMAVASRQGYAQLRTLGSARWANQRDLRQAGMLGGHSGLILGHLLVGDRGRAIAAIMGLLRPGIIAKESCRELLASVNSGRGPLVRLPRAIHSAVFAPSGAGKGVSLIIPFLMSCRDSCVVVDFKGENAMLTAEHRRKAFGHQIVLLDPFKVVTQTPDRFNSLDPIDENDPQAIEDCMERAKALVVRTEDERERHWNDSCELWIAAFIAVVIFYGNANEGTRSLQTVRQMLTDPQKLEMAIKVMLESKVCGGMLARMGGQLTHFIDKEKSSTLTTVSRHLRFLDTLAVSESTTSSSFDPAELRAGKMTVYLILPPNRMSSQSSLLRLWIVSLLQAVVAGGLQERKLVHFILDEAASLGKLDAVDDALDKYRGYGIRLLFIFQSLGQLKKCFPNGQEQTLLSNTSQVFFAVNDNGLPGGVGTGDYVSARLGEETIAVKSGGTSIGRTRQWSNGSSQQGGSGSESTNSSSNWQQQARKLLKPEEVVALSPRTAITFTPGVRPIPTSLVRYYERGALGNHGLAGRSFAACKTLLIATVTCSLALLLAIRFTEVSLKEHGPRRVPAPQPQYLPQQTNDALPDVPAEGDVHSRKE